MRRASQKRLRLLKRIDEPLRAMLWPGERVVFLTSGVLYSFWESYFLGLPMYYLNRRALILTTERLILLQIDSRHRPRELRSHIRLPVIDALTRTGLGSTKIRLRSGARYSIAYVPRSDRKVLVELTRTAKGRSGKPATVDSLEHLCPHCYAAIDGHPARCPNCAGGLKSASKAGWLSLIFPGLGDFYIGHRKLAIMEMVIATVVWAGVLLPDPNAPITAAERITVAVLVFLFMHGFDSITTRFVARKGHYPGTAPAAHPASAVTAA